MTTAFEYYAKRHYDNIAALKAKRERGENLTTSEWLQLSRAAMWEDENEKRV